MDPWFNTNTSATPSNNRLLQEFEDNFHPIVDYKLPDSEQYLATLEEKLYKIKNDPNILRQLSEKREACMQQLLCGDSTFVEVGFDLDEPVNNSQILRTILPQKQALNQGEIVELVKYDQLSNEESDTDVNRDCEENRSF